MVHIETTVQMCTIPVSTRTEKQLFRAPNKCKEMLKSVLLAYTEKPVLHSIYVHKSIRIM